MADVRKLKEKATEAFSKGKFTKAGEAYAEYCAADPKDLQARLRMGDAWAKGGKKDKAIEAYTWAAEGFAKDGFLPRAIAASKLILELDPSHTGVQKMLANLYARKTGPGVGSSGPSSRTAPAPRGDPKVEQKIDTQTTAAGFADRKDAIELDSKPAAAPKRPVSAAKSEGPPSPMNRADAIELPAYEVPGAETATAGSSFQPIATKGPRPTMREDAIEIEEEDTGRRGPAALNETSIELDVGVVGGGKAVEPPPPPPRPSVPTIEVELAGAQPVSGEFEIPIEGAPLPPPPPAPLPLPPPPPAPPAASPGEQSAVFELTVEAPGERSARFKRKKSEPAPAAPPGESSGAFELKVEEPPAAPPAPAAAEKPAPGPAEKVWDLGDEPVEELEVVETVVSEELELVEVAPGELPAPRAAEPEPTPLVKVKPQLEVIPDEPKPAASSLPPGLKLRRAGVESRPAAPAAAPPGEQSATFDLTVEAPAPSAPPPPAATSPGEQSATFDLTVEAPAPSAPPRAAPVEAPAQAPRIWLPGNFATPAPAAPAPEVAAAAAPAPEPAFDAPAASASSLTDLERGMEIFSRFDVEDFVAPKAAAPAPPPPPRAPVPAAHVPAPEAAAAKAEGRRTFTELELEGDSLLHAVEAAAEMGLEQRGQGAAPVVEEAMEMPDDARLAPGELPKIPLFSDLPPDAFIALFERCPLKRVEPGEIVIQQGSLGDSFYVICAGSVKVFRNDGERRREIATLEEGAFFGEMALLSGAARAASVEAATEDTQLLEISAPILSELSHRYPQVASALKKFCRQRLLSNLMNTATLFAPFSRNDRRDLVQRFRARDVSKGDVLIKEGQSSDGMYVILSGEVEVRVGATQVASLKEGDVFGEMSLLTKAPATASVAASKRTSLLRLPREDFDKIIMSHPQVLVLVSELTDSRTKQNATLASHSGASADVAPMV